MADNKQAGEESQKPSGPESKNWLEWLIFGVSTILVLATIAYLGYRTLTLDHKMPNLKAAVGEPIRHGEGIQVPVTVYNAGDETAESVEVEVTASGGDSGSFTLAFVPREAKRKGWVIFEKPYRKGQLRAAVKGFEQP